MRSNDNFSFPLETNKVSCFVMSHFQFNPDRGLRFMRETMFNITNGDRPEASNIGVVITDGASNDPQKTVLEAESARDSGILLISVGVGRANMAELNAIATDPDTDHVFTVTNFSQLSAIAARFQATTCSGRSK